jgi:hypothetical protein
VPVKYGASLFACLLVGFVYDHDIRLGELKSKLVHPGVNRIERANLNRGFWVSHIGEARRNHTKGNSCTTQPVDNLPG